MSLGPESQEQATNDFILDLYLPEKTCRRILERPEEIQQAIENYTNNPQNAIQFLVELMGINQEYLPSLRPNDFPSNNTNADKTEGYIRISLRITNPNFSLRDLKKSLQEDYTGLDYIGELKRRIFNILNIAGLQRHGACQGCMLNPANCPTQIQDMQEIIFPIPKNSKRKPSPFYALILN